jgi:hypothetical protein
MLMTAVLDICTVCADELPGTTPGVYAHICEPCRADDFSIAFDVLDDVRAHSSLDEHASAHARRRVDCVVCWALDVVESEPDDESE